MLKTRSRSPHTILQILGRTCYVCAKTYTRLICDVVCVCFSVSSSIIKEQLNLLKLQLFYRNCPYIPGTNVVLFKFKYSTCFWKHFWEFTQFLLINKITIKTGTYIITYSASLGNCNQHSSLFNLKKCFITEKPGQITCIFASIIRIKPFLFFTHC